MRARRCRVPSPMQIRGVWLSSDRRGAPRGANLDLQRTTDANTNPPPPATRLMQHRRGPKLPGGPSSCFSPGRWTWWCHCRWSVGTGLPSTSNLERCFLSSPGRSGLSTSRISPGGSRRIRRKGRRDVRRSRMSSDRG